MRKVYEFSNSKFYMTLIFYFAVIAVCVRMCVKLCTSSYEGDDAFIGKALSAAIGIFALCFVYISVMWIIRKAGKTGVFSISEKGLENTYVFYNLFAFYFMKKIDLIPWYCINEFRVVSALGRKQVTAVVDQKKIPGKTPFMKRIFLQDDFYFGSRSTDVPADELAEELNRYLFQFKASMKD